jgi:hypothetical protein
VIEDFDFTLTDIRERGANGGFVIEDTNYRLNDIVEPVAQGGFVVSNFFISKKKLITHFNKYITNK